MIACTVTVLATAAVARPLARIYDVETAAWRTDTPVELLSGAFNFLVPTLVWGLIGLTIAVLTRSAGVVLGRGPNLTRWARVSVAGVRWLTDR